MLNINIFIIIYQYYIFIYKFRFFIVYFNIVFLTVLCSFVLNNKLLIFLSFYNGDDCN